jgi:LemA protein
MVLILVAVVALGVLLAGVGYGVALYNRLVSLKFNVGKNWSNIDVLLKQRHDELPKLVETCKQYMKYESETLEKVMKARASMSQALEGGKVTAIGAAEAQLRTTLGGLYAVAENYPDLKANASFQGLQTRISGLENAIADRRELYNEGVNLYNARIAQVPEVFLARLFAFAPFDFLRFAEEETRDVNVGALFRS